MTELIRKFVIVIVIFGFVEGKLRKIDPQTGEPGDEPFDFNISKDHATNQRNYEALGEVGLF